MILGKKLEQKRWQETPEAPLVHGRTDRRTVRAPGVALCLWTWPRGRGGWHRLPASPGGSSRVHGVPVGAALEGGKYTGAGGPAAAGPAPRWLWWEQERSPSGPLGFLWGQGAVGGISGDWGSLGKGQKARDSKQSPETGQEPPAPGWVPRRPRGSGPLAEGAEREDLSWWTWSRPGPRCEKSTLQSSASLSV